MRILDWLGPMLRTWGRQRRRVLTGRRTQRDGAEHVDGYTNRSTASLLREGGSSGRHEQHYCEVYSGDALIVWRELQTAPEEVRGILEVHYAWPGEKLAKARTLGVDERTYMAQLRTAEGYLAARLDPDAAPHRVSL
jgi:hypothetical protein